jgi:hypothetical protein
VGGGDHHGKPNAVGHSPHILARGRRDAGDVFRGRRQWYTGSSTVANRLFSQVSAFEVSAFNHHVSVLAS